LQKKKRKGRKEQTQEYENDYVIKTRKISSV